MRAYKKPEASVDLFRLDSEYAGGCASAAQLNPWTEDTIMEIVKVWGPLYTSDPENGPVMTLLELSEAFKMEPADVYNYCKDYYTNGIVTSFVTQVSAWCDAEITYEPNEAPCYHSVANAGPGIS